MGGGSRMSSLPGNGPGERSVPGTLRNGVEEHGAFIGNTSDPPTILEPTWGAAPMSANAPHLIRALVRC